MSWEKFHTEKEWGQYPSEHLVRFIATRFYAAPDRKKIKILDLGCGAGASIFYLEREGFDVYGCDISQAALDRCKEKFPSVGFWLADAKLLPYRDEKFDCVIDICCLQHVDDLDAALSQVHRVLKPGGRLFSIMADDRHHRNILPGVFTRFIPYAELTAALLRNGFDGNVYSSQFYMTHSRLISQWLIECSKS